MGELDVSGWKVFKGHELTNTQYHAEKDHSSSSNLKDLIKKKPGRFDKEGDLWGVEKYYQEKILGNKKPQAEKAAFTEGSYAHALILEPQMIPEDFAFYPEFRKQGKEWEAFKSTEQSGKNRTILSKPQVKRVQGWVEGYKLNQTAVDMIGRCECEYSLYGVLNGVKIKVRADAIDVERGLILDVKTTASDTDRDSFAQTVMDFEYELSGTLYAKMFSLYYGKPFKFLFVVLGKKDRSCEVFELGKKSVEAGERKIADALRTYKRCRKSNIWLNEEQPKQLELRTYDNYEILTV